MKPQAGGKYVYVRDGYGPLAGFLYAWTWFVIAKPASIATVTTGIVRILGTFSVFGFFSNSVMNQPFVITYGQLVAIAATILISCLNYIGIRRAGEFQLIFTLLKVAIILGIVVIGFSYSAGSWSHFAGNYACAKGGFTGFMAALVAALWAYDGWNDLNMVAGEIRRSGTQYSDRADRWRSRRGRSVHDGQRCRAICFARQRDCRFGATGVGCYRLGLGRARSGHGFHCHGGFHASHAERHDHERGAVPFAMARDRYFFSALAEVHPRFHTPSVAWLCKRHWRLLCCCSEEVSGNCSRWRSSPSGCST